MSRERAPLVTVVLPVYEVEDLLDDTLRSLREQTVKDLEVIAVDDGSKDGSLGVLRRHAERWPALRVVSQENRGAAAARNHAFDLARGKFIALQDSDDTSEPRRFERQLDLLRARPDVDLVGTDARLIDGDGEHLGESHASPDPAELERVAREVGTPVCHPSLMLRREILDEGHRYDPTWANCHDYDFISRVMRTHRASNVTEPLYRLRAHGAQLSVRFLEAGGYRTLAAIHFIQRGEAPTLDLGAVRRADVLALGITAREVDEMIIGRYRHWIRLLGAGRRADAVAGLLERGHAYAREHDVDRDLRVALDVEAALAMRRPLREASRLSRALRRDWRSTLGVARTVMAHRVHVALTDPARPTLRRIDRIRRARRHRN